MRKHWFRLGLCVLAALFLPAAAHAWKPYTHNTSAAEAYFDALDGFVTIEGRLYAVSPEIVAALGSYPQFYNAGVIGPDGFPDLTYGQSVIHPEQTGSWLRHMLDSAQSAQSDPALSQAERRQILAFAYGFLTHAAGDMWGHTFVNDFARGVFPGVSEILTDTEAASIALRHIATEGYIGDATPGFDGFQDGDDAQEARAAAPGTDCPGNILCDTSDDSTEGISYDAPHDFIYSTLVDPDAATPQPDRGPIIDFFVDLQSGLEDFVSSNPDPIGDALAAFDDTAESLDALGNACNFGVGIGNDLDAAADALADLINCPAALLELGFDVAIDSFEAFVAFSAGVLETAALAVLDSYLAAWIDDITTGLTHWSELGLATTKALFDPQERRNLQNQLCQFDGAETSLLRALCENGVGLVDVVFDSLDPFINAYLLSMLGAPDFVGDVRGAVQDILTEVDAVLGILLGPFNPIREALATIEEYAKDLITDAISSALGVDIDALHSLLTQPSRWICLDSQVFDFPQPLGTQTVSLFPGGEHARLDGLLGLPSGHHVAEDGLPLDCGRLADNAEISFAGVKALRNTVTTAKLLLLDGPELNRVLGDILGRTIVHYSAGQNLMVQALAHSDDWLLSIDGDHAWRQDGLPRFCDQGGSCPGDAEPRSADLNGGAGNFPLWESCVLRPAFRALFADWEGSNFPDLQDDVSADAANDPQAPASTLGLTGTTFTSGGRTWVAASHQFTQAAHDAPAGLAYRDDQLALRRRVYPASGSPGSFQAVSQNSTFKLEGADGIYQIEIQSADDCHRFDNLPSPPEDVQTSAFTLDTTPPVVTCNTPPFNLEWDTDDAPAVDFDITDGVDGSGIATQSSTVDGFQGLPGVVPTSDGATLDLFFFYPGTRRVVTSAADNLGNADVTTCAFELHATPQSLLSNINRAQSLGLITNHGIANSLRAKMQQIQSLHERGQHGAEANVLRAFINELQAQRGKKVDAATADRFIAFALDLISLGR